MNRRGGEKSSEERDMRTFHLVAAAALAVIGTLAPQSAIVAAEPAPAAPRAKPNLVLILTDNHGPWTLGCYGNRDVRTPHIDRLAAEGALFTHAYSSNAVCSPTRATFLTGLVPSQHGVHCFLAGGPPQVGEGSYCTIGEFRSLGEILKDAGYACGLSGKWHLGANMSPQEGFDDLWITKPAGSSAEFYDQEVIENGEVRKEPQYLTDLWTDRGTEFITEHRERPFFLFLAYNGPYGLGKLLLNEARNRHKDYYADKLLPSFPRHEPHVWLFNNREYINNPVSIRRYAAEISAVDDGVGRVMDALKHAQLDENTLVVFTADQGLAGGHQGFWGMGDHTRPLTAYDWTMHIPLIFRRPGHVQAGLRSNALVSNYDFLPTVLATLNVSEPSKASRERERPESAPPSHLQSPGRDFSPILRGEQLATSDDDAMFFEFETVRAVRTRTMKLIRRHPDGPHELYDLQTDPGETRNLHDVPEYAAARDELLTRLGAFFARYADPQYDLWKAGRSKAPLHSKRAEARN
jgi:arylsulfatase A-like enzyme